MLGCYVYCVVRHTDVLWRDGTWRNVLQGNAPRYTLCDAHTMAGNAPLARRCAMRAVRQARRCTTHAASGGGLARAMCSAMRAGRITYRPDTIEMVVVRTVLEHSAHFESSPDLQANPNPIKHT